MTYSGTGVSPVRSESYSYDAADQLTGATYSTNNLVVRTVFYSYDAAGNRTGMVDIAATTTNTTSYTANSDNQLTSRVATVQPLAVTGYVEPGFKSNKWYASTASARGVSAGVSSTNGTFAVGNVPVTDGANALTVTVTDVSGNIGMQIVSFTVAGTQSIGYDLNGNQTNENAWAFVYDRENRLISATAASLTVNYSYDALGRLIERRTSGASATTNRLYYAGWQLIAEYNGAGALQRKYVYGPGIDEPVRTTAGTTNYYYHAEGLGSVAEITDSSGLKAESYTYDVYGAPTFYNASGVVTNGSAMCNRLMFTARDRDPDTGWYNYRYRYYNPTLGRFVHRDPVGIGSGDFNLYRYALNNPARWKDSFGLEAIIVFNNGTSLTSPTGGDFLKQLQAAADNSIKSIDIYGHSDGINQSFNPSEGNPNGGITVNTTSKYPGIYLFSVDDTGNLGSPLINITQLLRSKLAKNARVGLRGCFMADTARDISSFLSGATVVGATGPTTYHSPEDGLPSFTAAEGIFFWNSSIWQAYQNGQPKK
jgi:RHS repeat-associated protein